MFQFRADILNVKRDEALQLLNDRGFTLNYYKGGERRFEGTLQCNGGDVLIELSIEDWNFLKYPNIKVIQAPADLEGLRAHLTIDGHLCYFAKNSVVLNRYDPASAIDQCLTQARFVLSSSARDHEVNAREVLAEFPNYWGDTQSPYGFIRQKDTTSPLLIFSVKSDDSPIKAIVCESEDYAKSYFQAWVPNIEPECLGQCMVLSVSSPPPINSSSLPTNVKELLLWLNKWSHALYQRFNTTLERSSKFLELTRLICLIQYPDGEIAFSFKNANSFIKPRYNSNPHNKVTPLSASKFAGKAYKQYIHTNGKSMELSRLVFHDLTPDFIHSRNIEHPSLAGKKILLIGCGAIGGHLANQLASLGAGSNEGRLVLQDFDKLATENIGRHLLGIQYLFKQKSVAVGNYLKDRFPASEFLSISERFTDGKNLHQFDLILDATGDEAFGRFLNALRIEHKDSPPVLHVWVKGNGECVQGLWCDGIGACYHCLRLDNSDQFHLERFEVSLVPTRLVHKACSTFTPYSVTAAVSAATLATEMVVDWIQGNPSPRWRTNYRENADARKIRSQNIDALEKCPACNANKVKM